MVYPLATKTLRTRMTELEATVTLVQTTAQQQKSLSQSGQLNMDMVRRFFDVLVKGNNDIIAAAAVSGLADFISTEKGVTSASVTQAFTDIRNAIIATLDWLRTNVPTGTFVGTTYRQAFFFPTDNTSYATALTFTAGQTAGYVTALNTLLATFG